MLVGVDGGVCGFVLFSVELSGRETLYVDLHEVLNHVISHIKSLFCLDIKL
jgi:hypothetical protein